MLICKAILGLLSNYLGIYVTSTNIWTLAVYSFPFVASSPDRDVPDSLYDALSASCKFVFLKARKFRNSFLWQSSKHSLQLCEMNPWELSLLWISFFFSFFFFGGDARPVSLCRSACLSPELFTLYYLSKTSIYRIWLSYRWGLPCRFWIPKGAIWLNIDLALKWSISESLSCVLIMFDAYWFPRT